jgi:hypothetical protein
LLSKYTIWKKEIFTFSPMDPTVATIICILLFLGIAPKLSQEGNAKHAEDTSKQAGAEQSVAAAEQPKAAAEQPKAAAEQPKAAAGQPKAEA